MVSTLQLKKLNEIAEDAHRNRAKLIAMFKKQGSGNVVINLVHGCTYVYGETIKNPEICFNAGNSIKDTELWAKTVWANK